MRERIICPECENVFHLEIEEARTQITCSRCSHSFAHISNGADLDNEDETVSVRLLKSDDPDDSGDALPGDRPGKIEDDPAPGMIFGNYEIINEIARGATGIVYKARQKNLDRIVALKVLIAGETASEEQIKRFHQEARAVAKLRHPNIVPVYDVGLFKGKHYFAMEYVDGLPLHRAMKKERFSPNKALDIILKVAGAIAAAHEAHIIHRDIKPANVMIDEAGRVQVMDFGLAKQVEADTQYTRSGTTMGTPNYMPVEQAQGDVKNIDERSDIYSLGAVLYEMLTGVPPFVAETNLKTILKVINEEPMPPRKRNPYIHRDIETICMKAMDKDRERRYATVGDFVDDIKRFQTGEPILARPASTIYRLGKKIRKYRAVIAASLMTIALGLLVIVAVDYFFPPPPPPNLQQGRPSLMPRPIIRAEKFIPIPLEQPTAGEREDFLKEAVSGQAYLPLRLDVNSLPEDLRFDFDIIVGPGVRKGSSIGCYIFGDMPGGDGNYLKGYAVKFFFENSDFTRIEFQRGGSPRGPGWANPGIQASEGKLHCSVNIRKSREGVWQIEPVVNGKKFKPYPLRERDIISGPKSWGCGMLLYGRGLDIDNVALNEIVPPAQDLLSIAANSFEDGHWEKAIHYYTKFLNAYNSERGKPQSEGGIKQETYIAGELRRAFAYAHWSGVFEDDSFVDGGLVEAATVDMEKIAREHYKTEYRSFAQEADIWIRRIYLCRNKEADLAEYAEELAQKYDITRFEAASAVLHGLSVSRIDALLQRTARDDLAIQLYKSLAERLWNRGDFSGYARFLLEIADYYMRARDWSGAREAFVKIRETAEDYPVELYQYRIKAEVSIAEIHREEGNFEKYYEAISEILYRFQVSRGDDIEFQPELAEAKLTLASDLINEAAGDRQAFYTSGYLSYAMWYLEGFPLYLKPYFRSIPPEPDCAGMSEYEARLEKEEWKMEVESAEKWQNENPQRVRLFNRWLELSYAAARLLSNVWKVQQINPITPGNIIEQVEYFSRRKNVPENYRAELKFISGEVLQHFSDYDGARKIFEQLYQDAIKERKNPLGAVRALNHLIENCLVEGFSKNGSAADIDTKSILLVLDRLGRVSDDGDDVSEAKLHAGMKAFLAFALRRLAGGREDEETKDGMARLLDKFDDDISRLPRASFIRKIFDLLGYAGPIDDPYVDNYLKFADAHSPGGEDNELKFWLGVKLLLLDKKDEAETYFTQILDKDLFFEYWYSRFIRAYFNAVGSPVIPHT